MEHYVEKDNFRNYDFEKTLEFLLKIARIKFGSNFEFDPADKSILYALAVHSVRDEGNSKNLGLDLNKGILLIGPVGCGKTSLMTLFSEITPPNFDYKVKSTRDIASEYHLNGFSSVQKYAKANKNFCFDDLGIENNLKHFGNECNSMAEILLSRYESMKNFRVLTHATSNLNSIEIESFYGNRVRSRLREMFNLISFPESAKDKRK